MSHPLPHVLRAGLAALGLVTATLAAAAPVTVFSDDFEDGSVADWSVSASAGVITPVVATRSDAVHGGLYAMQTYFDAPSGGVGSNFVRASHSFTAAATGDYLLELWARSAPCGGCAMYFDVLVDGMSQLHDGSAQTTYAFRSLTLSNLTAGLHTLTLGMFTTDASSGRFQASFDDVRITTETSATVPEPTTLALVAGGLLLAGARRRR